MAIIQKGISTIAIYESYRELFLSVAFSFYLNPSLDKNSPIRRLLDSPLHIVRSVPKVFHTVLKIVVLFHGVAILYG